MPSHNHGEHSELTRADFFDSADYDTYRRQSGLDERDDQRTPALDKPRRRKASPLRKGDGSLSASTTNFDNFLKVHGPANKAEQNNLYRSVSKIGSYGKYDTAIGNRAGAYYVRCHTGKPYLVLPTEKARDRFCRLVFNP